MVVTRRARGGPDPKTKRSLEKQFDKCDDDPEPIRADEPMKPAALLQAAASSADGVPVEAQPGDFWATMDLISEVTIALDGLENKLATKSQAEAECRKSEARATKARIGDVMVSLEHPETRVRAREHSRDGQGECRGMEARHVIIGGWSERSPRELVEREAKRWLEKLHVASRALRQMHREHMGRS